MPTLLPDFASCDRKVDGTVVCLHPPFPAPTAIDVLDARHGRGCRQPAIPCATRALLFTRTRHARPVHTRGPAGSASALSTWSTRCVSSIVNETRQDAIDRSLMNPRLTMSGEVGILTTFHCLEDHWPVKCQRSQEYVPAFQVAVQNALSSFVEEKPTVCNTRAGVSFEQIDGNDPSRHQPGNGD